MADNTQKITFKCQKQIYWSNTPLRFGGRLRLETNLGPDGPRPVNWDKIRTAPSPKKVSLKYTIFLALFNPDLAER